MSQPSFFDNVREWIGGIAFAIYLWSVRMSKEEFWAEQDRDAVEHLRAADVCHVSSDGVHEWYTGSNWLVCSHCGTRR